MRQMTQTRTHGSKPRHKRHEKKNKKQGLLQHVAEVGADTRVAA